MTIITIAKGTKPAVFIDLVLIIQAKQITNILKRKRVQREKKKVLLMKKLHRRNISTGRANPTAIWIPRRRGYFFPNCNLPIAYLFIW